MTGFTCHTFKYYIQTLLINHTMVQNIFQSLTSGDLDEYDVQGTVGDCFDFDTQNEAWFVKSYEFKKSFILCGGYGNLRGHIFKDLKVFFVWVQFRFLKDSNQGWNFLTPLLWLIQIWIWTTMQISNLYLDSEDLNFTFQELLRQNLCLFLNFYNCWFEMCNSFQAEVAMFTSNDGWLPEYIQFQDDTGKG